MIFRAILLVLCLAGSAVASAPSEAPDIPDNTLNTHSSLIEAYDLPTADFQVDQEVIRPGDYLGKILAARGVSQQTIHQVAKAGKAVFDIRRLKQGQPYLALRDRERGGALRFLVYDENDQDYVVFDLGEEPSVYRGRKLKRLREREVSGVIATSLYDALAQQDLPIVLSNAMADIFNHRVNFKKLQKGDQFKLIFEEELAGGEVVGLGKIKAAWFKRDDQEHYAFLYETQFESLYLDGSGVGERTGFLQAPIKGGRVSSNYSGRRFHPVQKRYKAHLGTDYAAPTGTPILAMADGEVTEASRTRYNGNYVKLKHDAVYETQYLHMVRIAEGMKPGVKVRKGQVIGYVGSTGLAVGTHVCLRFWKNGRQVNFQRQNFRDTHEKVAVTPAQYAALIEPMKNRLSNMADVTK